MSAVSYRTLGESVRGHQGRLRDHCLMESHAVHGLVHHQKECAGCGTSDLVDAVWEKTAGSVSIVKEEAIRQAVRRDPF